MSSRRDLILSLAILASLLMFTPRARADEPIKNEAESLAGEIAREKKAEFELEDKKAEVDRHLQQGKSLYDGGDYREALGEFERALEIDPRNRRAKRYLGRCQKGLKRVEENRLRQAEEEMRKEKALARLQEEREREEKLKGELGEGKEHLRRGYYEKARGEWEKVVEATTPDERDHKLAQSLLRESRASELAREREELAEEEEFSEEEMILEIEKSWIPPERLRLERPVVEITREGLEKEARLEEKLKTSLVTLEFDQMPLRQVIEKIKKDYSINLILDERVFLDEREEYLVTGISPRVSVYLKDIPLGEALEVILRTKRLKYRIEESLVWITSAQSLLAEEPVMRVYQLSGEAGNIEKIITSAIPQWPEETGISFDARSGTLMVKHIPAYQELIKDIIRQVDIIPIQVLIETKFIEVNEELWRGLRTQLDNLTGYGFALYLDQDDLNAGTVDIDTSFPVIDLAGRGGVVFDYWRLKDTAYHALVEALASSERSKLLSAPRVTTQNNQEATIELVTPYHYPQDYSVEEESYEQTVGGEVIEVRQDLVRPTSFTERNVGITLKVTPNVGADRRTISLTLQPEIIELIDEDTNYFGTANTWSQTFPIFGIRRVTTSVLVEDGEAVVLGGLLKETETARTSKVPFLGDIPILGRAFRRDVSDSEKTNLLIFVTAYILTPSGERHIE